MLALGMRWAMWRLLGRRPLLTWAFCLLVVVATALVERRSVTLLAAERVLLGAVSGMTIPLLVYAGAALVFGIPPGVANAPPTGAASVAPGIAAVRYGGDRRLWLLGVIVGTGMLLAVGCAALACASLVAAGGSQGLPLLSDLRATAMVCALGAVAYVAFFALGSTVGRGGWLRPVLLLVDWVLGGLGTAVALPFPRGHIRALLGAEPVIELSQSTTWVVLWGLVIAYMLLALLRTPR